ncbi:MAG TPA: recombinase, partial [Halomonas sp.]|nr:recombinase [Halomonas sp.]
MSEQTASGLAEGLKPDQVLDATGLHCPLPL